MAVGGDSAVHEASHCVACRALGVDVERVEIDDGPFAGGRFFYATPVDVWPQLVVMQAGQAGEDYAEPGRDHRQGRTEDGDDNQAFQLARRVETAEASAGWLLHSAYWAAYDLLVQRWDQVERLAAALRQHRRLDRADIERILAVRPAPVLPASGTRGAASSRCINVAHDGKSRLWLADRPEISAGSLDELFAKLPAEKHFNILGAPLPSHMRSRAGRSTLRMPPTGIMHRVGALI